MKIALVHKRLDGRGGTERDLFRTAEGLRDLGHEVNLFCAEYGIPPPEGTLAHLLPVLPLGRTARLLSLAWLGPRIPRRFGCEVVIGFGRLMRQDVIRCGGGSHQVFLRRMARYGGLRRVWQSVSVYHRAVLAIEKRQYRLDRFKKIIAVSAAVKNDLMENYHIPAERITVLYNGVDTELFHPTKRAEQRAVVRAEYNIPAEAPLVLFVGSGFQRKGLDRLFSLWNTPALKAVFLLAVGDDARLSNYRARAEAIAGKRIIFAGRREDVENFYAAADVVALPSLQEAFGNVVLEALASGVPVLVSRDAGAAEILCGSLAQGIVEAGAAEPDLACSLRQLLERSRDSAVRREARQLAERYSWSRHFEQFDALLRDVAAKQRCEL